MKKLTFLLLAVFGLLVSCNNKTEVQNNVLTTNDTTEYLDCTTPVCTILLQPYDKTAEKYAKDVSKTLKERIESMDYICVQQVKVLPIKQLPDTLLNQAKIRYRATKILDFQKQSHHKSHDVIIGVTSSDISTSIHGYQDYGIQGLAYMGQENCVVSTYRLKNKKDLWKPMVHEFFHAFMHMPHCPADDPTCIMQDGHGKPNWTKRTKICNKCLGYDAQ